MLTFKFLFEKPDNWDDFEDLVCDVVRDEFQNPNFQRYGSQGQPQDGIDIYGLTSRGSIGIQCKKVEKKLNKKDIKDIISKAEKFTPKLDQLVLATTNKRDKNIDDLVFEFNKDSKRPFDIAVWYWKDIVDMMKEHPRLIYKYFGSDYKDTVNDIRSSNYFTPQRTPIKWPFSEEDLEAHCRETLGEPQNIVTPYTLSIGISSFSSSKHSIPIDFEIDLTSVIDGKIPLQAFDEIRSVFDSVCSVINSVFFSTVIVFDFNLYLSHAFLLGNAFKKKKNWCPLFVQGSMIWPSQGLDLTYSGLRIHAPYSTGRQSTEIAVVLSKRDIKKRVIDNIESWENKPGIIYFFSFDGDIRGSAVPMSLSIDFAKTIDSLIDEGSVSRIHLFLAVPKSLAALVAVKWNRTCPISLYHLDRDRKTYQLSGTIELE